jgi:hypothetical protein
LTVILRIKAWGLDFTLASDAVDVGQNFDNDKIQFWEDFFS